MGNIGLMESSYLGEVRSNLPIGGVVRLLTGFNGSMGFDMAV